jgi:peptidoglycan/LPS O-acetylase OafA/YrhL
MSGGYVGVDVFFVISGFLISSIIFSDIANSRFSIAGFYERRIRRIFPALFAMLLVYSVVAYMVFLPSELVEYAKTLMATTVSGSNFYLWSQFGYFDQRYTNPLLHTWSLAVEEQFYILFPILLILARRVIPRRLRESVVVLSVLSLALSVIYVAKNPDTSFYMPYTRAWEMLLGTIVALGLFPPLRSAWLRNLVALTGLAMILYSVFFYSSATRFPGLAALLPCVGSALIIGAGISGKSIVYSILSWRPLVFTGLISYSLYLWHWPVITVYHMGIVTPSSWFENSNGNRFQSSRIDHIALVIVSFVLAYLSWKFVELPFRKGRLKTALPRRPLFVAAAAFAMLLICFSAVSISSGGLKARFSPDTLQAAAYLDKAELQKEEDAQRLGTCFLDARTGIMNFDFNYCLQTKPGVKNYLLLGDSHAAAIWPALQGSLPGVNVMQVNVTGCPPTIGDHPASSLCKKVMDYVYQEYLPAHPVQALILESAWSTNSLPKLDETLQWASEHGVRTIVIGCVPEYGAALAQLVAYSIAWNQPRLPSRHLLVGEGELEPHLRALVADKWHFQFVSLYDVLCQGGVCKEYADANKHIPLMDDNNHLNLLGAQYVISQIVNSGQLR